MASLVRTGPRNCTYQPHRADAKGLLIYAKMYSEPTLQPHKLTPSRVAYLDNARLRATERRIFKGSLGAKSLKSGAYLPRTTSNASRAFLV